MSSEPIPMMEGGDQLNLQNMNLGNQPLIDVSTIEVNYFSFNSEKILIINTRFLKILSKE